MQGLTAAGVCARASAPSAVCMTAAAPRSSRGKGRACGAAIMGSSSSLMAMATCPPVRRLRRRSSPSDARCVYVCACVSVCV